MSSIRRPSSDSINSPRASLPHSQSESYFPRFESSSRNASISRYNPRRGSTASSIHSIGGALDTAHGGWSEAVREAGQNAISTLLQPPIVRTGLVPHTHAPASSAHRPPTARDIPPVALTNIPHVEPASFKPYLNQVGKLYQALQRAKESQDEEGLEVIRRKSRHEEFPDLLGQGLNNQQRQSISRNGSVASISSLTSPEPPIPRRRSSGGGRRSTQGPAPLSTIPNVYFDDAFHLENPRTFDVVSERSEVIRPAAGTPDERKNSASGAPRKALATNAILQEKLSWYMDTIEVHLISAISTASSSFFAALGSLRELHSEAADSVARIKQLRQELEALDKEMALGGLEIVYKRRRRENLKKLNDAVIQLKSIVEAVKRCEAYVDQGRVERALDALEALERLIHGEQSDGDAKVLEAPRLDTLADLSSAVALKGVDGDLGVLRLRIGKTFEARFIRALLTDLRSHIETTSFEDTLKRWNSASLRARGGHSREQSTFPSYLTTSNEFRGEILSNLAGLYRSNYTSPATAAYKDAVLHEVKRIIKAPLPSSNDDDTDSIMSVATTAGGNRPRTQQDRGMALARNLRSLDSGDAEEMLVNIYIGVGEALRRLGTQVKVLLDVTTNLDGSTPGTPAGSPPRSPSLGSAQLGSIDAQLGNPADSMRIQEELHQALDMSNLLGQAVDLAQKQIVKVLKTRAGQAVSYDSTRFLRYFTLNLLFANECEAVSGRSGTVLKSVINNQIAEFMQQFARAQQKSLTEGMDSDNWNAKDFSEADDKILSLVLEATEHDPEAWSRGSKVWLPYNESSESGATNGVNGTEAAASSGKKETRPAIVASESFVLPQSAVVCLRGLVPYLELITGIPSLTSDISPLLISYLHLFNSRCTQLILGAGATKIVGLKNITAKHLTLASRALSFVSTLIPYIREYIRRHLTAGPALTSLMGEFDRVRQTYLDHQQSISEKLVDIMSGRVTICMRAMTGIKWDDPDVVAKNVSAPIETLTKETGTLHRVLTRHLPEPTVAGIMEPVLKNYKEQLGGMLRKADVTTEAGKQRMMRDAEHFAQKMAKMEGAGDLGDTIINIVKDKKLPEVEEAKPEKEETTNTTTTTNETESQSTATPDPPLPPTPDELEAEEKRKSESEGSNAVSTSTEEARINGLNDAEAAAAKELPPTPAAMNEEEEKEKGKIPK